jgi:hypothetical protein
MASAPSPSAPPRLDFAAIRAALRAGRAPNPWLARWLHAAYTGPERFTENLYEHGRARPGGLKSTPGRTVDLYHDLVIAHLGGSSRACAFREDGRTRELSYDALHTQAGALASAWHGEGLEPGDTLAIALPLGPDYVAALLAALRLGLIVCPLPPHGPTFVQNRLRALGPDAVLATGRERALLGKLELRVLGLAAGRKGIAPTSHSYAADDPVLRVFPAFGSAELTPVDVSAATLHAGLLRDATLVFALDPQDTIAMPGFEPLAVQPAALLAALLAGATWAELPASDAAQDPALLAELGVTVLGVRPELRDGLLAHAKWPVRSARAWFRSMADPIDLERWDALGRQSAAAGVAAFNTAFASTAGGAVLFGPVLPEAPGLRVWPVPGLRFCIAEIAGGVLPSLNDTGIHTPLAGEDAIPGVPKLLIARDREGYVCSGSIEVGPDARAYPIDEVSAVVETHPGVRHATVVISAGRLINTANVTLIAFVEDQPEKLSREELRELVAREMGQALAPTRIEVFPLRPRVGEDGLDRGWCRSQYLAGALTAKSRHEIFLLLSRLGYSMNPRESA